MCVNVCYIYDKIRICVVTIVTCLFMTNAKGVVYIYEQDSYWAVGPYCLKYSRMDLSKVKNDKKLYLCRWYFRAGFACLPFLWFVNTLWFFPEVFRKPSYEEQSMIKKYVILSGIGATLWLAALITWIVIFQTHRVAWGETADYMSFIIPTGIP